METKFASRTEFSLELEICGQKFEDVVSISATFGVNSIPTASVQVATGVNFQDGTPATIHSAFQSLVGRCPAKVHLTVKNTWKDGGVGADVLPNGRYLIFEGYYAGAGYQRSTTNATFSINLIHWIDDLNCSSVLNGNWFQGAPHDLAQAACQFSLPIGGSGVGSAIIAPIIALAKNGVFGKEKVSKDLWGNTLKPIFEALCKMPHPKQQGGTAGAGGVGGSDNATAQAALKRIPGGPKPAKLPLKVEGLSPEVLHHTLNNGITHLMISGISYSSFWGKLVGELGSSFLFGVSPSVEFGNVFPYFGGLQTPWKTISANQYSYANFNANAATLIESVDIFYSSQGASNWDIGGTGSPKMSYYEPWGSFPKQAADKNLKGHILLRDPPPWLANTVAHSSLAPPTTLRPGIDSLKPQANNAAAAAATAPESEQQVKQSNILDQYAEHWFKSAILGQRQGELSGILRFDIAPGSTVLIKAPVANFGSTADHIDLYAFVTQVSYVINAEQHVAGTSLSFTCMRSSAENQSPILTSPEPPLYSTGWSGGPLASITATGSAEGEAAGG